MSTKEHAERMSRALEGTGLAAPVSANFGENRVAILCRVSRDNEAGWIELVTKILSGANLSAKSSIPWQCHICRNYFLKEVNSEDKLVWGWNFSIHAREMTPALDTVIRLVKGQPIDTGLRELEEFPLQASADRGVPIRGKGATLSGHGKKETK